MGVKYLLAIRKERMNYNNLYIECGVGIWPENSEKIHLS